MPRHDCIDVEGEHPVQAADPSVKVAIAKPGKSADEQEVTQKHYFLVREMQDQVAVAVRWSPIVGAQGTVRTLEADAAVEGLRRPDQFDRMPGSDTNHRLSSEGPRQVSIACR